MTAKSPGTYLLCESFPTLGLTQQQMADRLGIAWKARQELEQRTGKLMVSHENALPPKGRKALKAPKSPEDDESS